jgi:SAM-dependent methyltransferase
MFAGELDNSSVTNDHRALREFLAAVPYGGNLLDLGSGERRLTDAAVNVDVVPSPEVDVVADGDQLPFPNAVFEAIVLQSVIEHVLEPEALLAESSRVLKESGRIWVEAPFLYPVHDSADYYRWTVAGLRHLVSKHFGVIESGVVMGPSSALSLGWRSYANWRLRRLHWATRNSVAWLTSWIKRLDPDQVLAEPPEIYAQAYVLAVKSHS